MRVLQSSSSGSWVLICQGQPGEKRLVLGAGPGEPVEDVYASDSAGRYLVASLGGVAWLIDTLTGERVDLSALGADVRRARVDYAVHRALSFSADGQLLAYLRHQDGKASIVLRQLEGGTERVFPTAAGDVLRLELSADARYVSFDALREDTSKNGKLDWPVPEEPAAKVGCEPEKLPRFRSFAYQGRGDQPTRALLATSDGSLRDVPGLITPVGESALVRDPDGSLKLEQRGKRAPFAPASCDGRVLFADAQRQLALVTCTLPKKPGKREVWLFGPGYSKNLRVELYETATDRQAQSGVRLVPLYPGSESALVDLERRELLPLAAGSRVVAVAGERALLWRGTELTSYDARSKTERSVARGVTRNPDLLQTGQALLLTPFVVIGAEPPALTSPTDRPLALSNRGHVLGAAQAPGVPSGAAIEGPLHWLDARVPAPDGPPR